MVFKINKNLNKLNLGQKIVYVFVFASLFISRPAWAAGLVPCDGIDDCNFDTLIKLLNNIASFLIFRVPLILLVVLIAYNGGLLIYNRDRSKQLSAIKKSFVNLLVGYLLILGAYVLVKTFITLIAGDNLTFKTFFN